MKNTDFNIGKIYSVKEINNIANAKPGALLEQSDEHFRREISAVVSRILEKSSGGGVIMLSGPSSSGKTTTSMMLRRMFEESGKAAVKISLDDFFLAADQTPVDEHGKRDFEGVSALNLRELNRCLKELAETGECYMPKYDFALKRPSAARQHIITRPGGFVIIEGLHAINPKLTEKINVANPTKLFLNVESSVEIDGKILNGLTLRMLRRLVRDTRFRSINADQCLELWDGVVAGERKNIVPFVKNSDIIIDSFHKSEICVVGARAIPILLSVSKGCPRYHEAQRLVKLLERVHKIDLSLLNNSSLLTEFTGGGSYEY